MVLNYMIILIKNYYRDMFEHIQKTMQSRGEMVQVYKGILQTTGRHLLEIS